MLEVKTCTRLSPHVCAVNGPCNGWPKKDRFIGDQGRQDSEYDNSLAEWGLGDIHPVRRRLWSWVGMLLIGVPWSVVVLALLHRFLHR
jgi:hypothetical protein